jgi:hypothetical protein
MKLGLSLQFCGRGEQAEPRLEASEQLVAVSDTGSPEVDPGRKESCVSKV